MLVTKRDGSMVPLDIKQVRKQTIPACAGLENVNYRGLEEDVELSLRDGITSREIQKILIRSAADKISIESPDYTYVAARLTLYDLYHSIKHYHGKKGSGDVYRMVTLKDYIKKYSNLFSEWYTKYTDEEIDELDSVIDGKRDLLFNYLGVEVLINRYLVRYNGKPVELPQHMHMCIAMFLMQDEKENRLKYIKDLYEETSNLRYINATPINSNGRVKDGGLVSCFLGYVGDSAESIMSMATNTALASKFGAGAGWDWSSVRAASDPIRGYPEASGGKIPMIKIYADILLAFNQLGTRMGAGCAYIECWDVEIFDFIDLKKKNGDERRRAHDLFLGVNVRDFFMQRLSSDSDAMMTLFSPYDVPDLRELYGEQFTARYEQYEKEFRTTPERFNKYTKQVKVMDVYKYMMQSWVESGTPFWHFIDTTNKKHAHPQLGVIRQSNLCVRGDTRILTKDYGYVRIGYLVEDGKTELECWNGKEWSMTKLMKTSDNSNLLTVKLSNKQDIYATPYHKWYRIVSDGSSVEKVTTEELQPGDKLCNFDLDIVQHGNKILPHPYTNGYLALDRDGDYRRIEIELWDEEEIKLAENLTGYVSTTDVYGFRGVDKNLSNDGELVFRYGTYTDDEDLFERTASLTDVDYGLPIKVLFYKKEDLLTQYTVPSSEYMLEDRLEWLAGLLDKCGDRGIDNGEDIISLKHHDMRFLKEVSLLLQELGIHSRFEDVKPTKTTQHYSPTLTNCFSSGTKLEYAKLIISLDKLLKIGVPFKVIQSVLVYVPDDSERPVSYITVESVTDEGITAPTYCGTEPKEHKLMFNGALTGNCTEVLQPTDEEHTAICNLGSLNVSRYVDEETLKKTIKIAVRALDNAIDLTVYPSKKAEITQKERRSIGLGALGEAEYVARHNMYYGSDEHKQFIDRFYKVMSDTVHETTKELAKEKGSCIVEGVRNAYLMCIAPNSTSGSFAGTTNSTEPVYSELWIEGNKDNEYYVTAPNITKENRKYYESAFVIDPIKQIECTAIRQKYIDMAISTNVHMNNIGLKASNIDKVVKKAWSEGLKTLYYFKTKAVKTITCVGCEN